MLSAVWLLFKSHFYSERTGFQKLLRTCKGANSNKEHSIIHKHLKVSLDYKLLFTLTTITVKWGYKPHSRLFMIWALALLLDEHTGQYLLYMNSLHVMPLIIAQPVRYRLSAVFINDQWASEQQHFWESFFRFIEIDTLFLGCQLLIFLRDIKEPEMYWLNSDLLYLKTVQLWSLVFVLAEKKGTFGHLDATWAPELHKKSWHLTSPRLLTNTLCVVYWLLEVILLPLVEQVQEYREPTEVH